MDLKELTDEQKARARECKTPAELLALAQEEGHELSDEELEAVVGGYGWACQDNYEEMPEAPW